CFSGNSCWKDPCDMRLADVATATIEVLDPQTDRRWDEFVRHHPAGTVYHHSAWTRVFEETYGHEPLHLGLVTAERGQLLGAISFQFINSWLTGKRLVSLPFTSYCNPLWPEDRLDEALEFGLDRFAGAQHIELKLLQLPGRPVMGGETPFVTHILWLDRDLEQ